MDHLSLANPVFATYAIAAAIMVLKGVAMSWLTVVKMAGENGCFRNPHVPRYPLVSATLIGRLAVAKERQGQRFGSILLADALSRALESAGTVESSMVMVDALDEEVAGFYAAHGLVRLPDSSRLILPMALARPKA